MDRKPRKPKRRNPVARHAARFQTAQVFRDRSKYRRHNKHKGRESWPVCIDVSTYRPGFLSFSLCLSTPLKTSRSGFRQGAVVALSFPDPR